MLLCHSLFLCVCACLCDWYNCEFLYVLACVREGETTSLDITFVFSVLFILLLMCTFFRSLHSLFLVIDQ